MTVFAISAIKARERFKKTIKQALTDKPQLKSNNIKTVAQIT